MAHKIIASDLRWPASPQNTGKSYVSVILKSVPIRFSIQCIIHTASATALEEQSYKKGALKLVSPHSRPIIAEGHLVDFFSNHQNKHRFDFNYSTIWIEKLRQNGYEFDDTPNFLAKFSSGKDVKKNILDNFNLHTFSQKSLHSFGIQDKKSITLSTLNSLSAAFSILEYLHNYKDTYPKSDKPIPRKFKILCGLLHQTQLAFLLDPSNLYIYATTFFNKINIPLIVADKPPKTVETLVAWMKQNPALFY